MNKLYINDDNLFNKEFHYLIPVSLQQNLYNILVSVGEEQYAKKHLSKFYYLIHKLREEVIINKSIEKDSYINLHSNILDDLLGSRYTPDILRILIKETNIIETDNHYIVGDKAKGYRLNRKYIDEPFVWYKDDSKFTQKLIQYKRNKIMKYMNKREYHSIFLNLTSLTFNYNKLKNYLIKFLNNLSLPNLSFFSFFLLCTDIFQEEHIIKELIDLQKELQSILYANTEEEPVLPNTICTYIFDSEEYTLTKLIHDLVCIIKIIKKDWFFVVDNKGNRLHNNITNLNKNLRECLVLDGCEDNVNIDISCSQPSLLAFQCMEYLGERGIDYRKQKDLVKYIIYCIRKDKENDIYMYLKKKIGFTGSRGEFKEVFFQILYGKLYETEFTKLFKQEFPTVWSIACEIKKKDYRQLSIQLMKLESNVMFFGVIKRLLEINPDICILTIHDSIFTKKENLELVKQVMSEVFYERFKERVRLSVDEYSLNEVSDSIKEMIYQERNEKQEKLNKERARTEADEFNNIHAPFEMFEIITDEF
jgi:hypothetical protein